MKPLKSSCCNPPCLKNCCNGGFNEDDPRYAATRPINPTMTNVQPAKVEQLPVYLGPGITGREGEVVGGKV